MKRGASRVLIVILLILVLLLGALIGGMVWFLNNYFFVGGLPFPNDAKSLDLSSQEISVEEYEAIREKLPDCRIRWRVPFRGGAQLNDITWLRMSSIAPQDLEMLSYFPGLQEVDASGCTDYPLLQQLEQQYPHLKVSYTVAIEGVEYPKDTTAVTVSRLAAEDVENMAYLPCLQTVDATACQDYQGLMLLAQQFPDVHISYQVEMLGQTFTEETVSASFRDPDVDVLLEELAYLPALESLHMEEPSASPTKLNQLRETYPDVHFTWNKTVLGMTFSSEDTEFDFSGMAFASTDPVEEAMAYFPNAEKVIMSHCGIDNYTMANFRDKMRQDYKVVWTVYVTKKPIRTDATIIHSSALEVCFIDELSYDLKYCEDAIVVDIGHSYVKYIDWVQYMPNLKYLILTHNWIKDLTPISSCKKLEYLEIYWNDHIPDYTPLQGCTALKDLNLSGTYADPEPLQQMTWLENLWANATDFTQAEKQALVEALPNTHIEFTGGDYTSKGWRQVQGYYDMRDLMGLPYNTW